MADQKWTKGPWSTYICNITGLREVVSNCEKELVICERAENDADLIAAAPELYDALESLIEAVTNIRGIDMEAYKPKELAKARAAIIKAHGE